MNVKEIVYDLVDWIQLTRDKILGGGDCCEDGNELPASLQNGEFDQLSDCQLHKKDSTSMS
jgi:hypothetical protein